jgi:hypothetical protein
MRSRKVILALACLAANGLLLETAHADRRTGLSGNLLIQDPDDLFPFPQYTLTHRNMLRLDYGPGTGASAVGTSGNGVLTLGDDNMAFGVALHRGDLLSPDVVGQAQELAWLGGVGNPFNAAANNDFGGPTLPTLGTTAGAVLPATVFDLFYGRRLGDNLLGMRLGLGRGVQAVKLDGDTEKGAQTFIALQGGYSMLPATGLRLDLSGNLVFALGKTTDASGDTVTSGTDIHFGMLARGYYPINPVVDIGFIGNLAIDNEHTNVDASDVGSNAFNAGLMAGVGPSINLARAKVAAYGGLTVGFGTREPNSENDDDEVSTLNFTAPMVNMATEVQLLDWMYVRTGAQYTWSLARAGYTAGGDDAADRVAAGVFGWTAGLGLTRNDFYFDGVVTNGFVTGGPNFIGGTTPGFLAMASFTYKFGDVFGDNPRTNEPAPAPVPERVRVERPVENAPPDPNPPTYESGVTGDAAAGDGKANAAGSIDISAGTP